MNRVLEGSNKNEVQRKASKKASKTHEEKQDKAFTAEAKNKREAAYKAGVEAAKKAAKHTPSKSELKKKKKEEKAGKELQEKIRAAHLKLKKRKHKNAEAH